MKLSDKIIRKFIDIINIKNWQVKSDIGFVDIKSINKTIPYEIYYLEFLNGQYLKCADNHILIDYEGNEIFAKDARDHYIKTDDEIGYCLCTKVIHLGDEENMYDLELADNSNHLYYTNGFLSHNTTSYTVFCMWYATLFPEKKIMICANKLQTAIEIMDRLRRAYEYLPKWLKPGIVTYNKASIEFSNMSSITASSTSSSAARGQSCNCLILDEMAFIPNNIIDDFFASVMPIISSSKNSKAIIVSTPNGASGLYYELWQQANSRSKEGNLDGWKPFRIHWWETGGIRDEAWKQKQISTIGLERWKQEFECDFLTSSTKRLIPEDVLEKYKRKISEYKTLGYLGKTIKLLSEAENNVYEFKMWHAFNPERTYAASGDISEGLGGSADSSVLYVWDITNLSEITLCAMFSSNKVSTVEFAYITNKILTLYNKPWFIAERNGISGGMIDSLRITYQYPHIVTEGKRGEAGIFSHVQTKGKACLWAREMLTNQCFGFKIYDESLIDEFNTFVKKNTKGIHSVYAALPKCHDDHIMAFVWLCYLLNNDIIEKYYIVASTVQSGLDQIYPNRIEPYNEYSMDDINKISNDPIYKDFIEFKNKLSKQVNYQLENSQADNVPDIYKYQQKSFDIYFNDNENARLGSKLNPAVTLAFFINNTDWGSF